MNQRPSESSLRQLDRVRLVVFDWAGTTVDHGCFAPLAPFIEAFAAVGVEIAANEARGPMGMDKKDHVRALLQTLDIAERFRLKHDRPWGEDDVEEIFTRYFTPAQLDSVKQHSRLVPGLLKCMEQLRSEGVRIGASTGYFRAAADLAAEAAAEQGYRPDCNVCADDVPAARPAPWMIYRNMEQLDVCPPAAVVKVGDTIPDVAAGRNAGVWSVGVTHTGSIIGCTQEELAALSADERKSRVQNARKQLTEAGAHYVIESVAELPSLVTHIDQQLESGGRP